MVYLLKSLGSSPARPAPPQRRRTIIIGGGPTGISAAFHLGEHSLVLERRDSLEESHDHSRNLSLGAARSGSLGTEDPGADGQRPGTSVPERKTLFIVCSTTGEASADRDKLIHVARWQPPLLAPESGTTPAPHDEFAADDQRETGSLRALVPLLRGELRLGANVVRVSPSLHMLELADGTRYVYDKLLSTVPIVELATLVMHELTSQISHAEFFRHWLSEYDIEVADQASQRCEGDIDGIAAGKRVAALINRSLVTRCQPRRRGSGFSTPRLVKAALATP